jgi:hypothetical protein
VNRLSQHLIELVFGNIGLGVTSGESLLCHVSPFEGSSAILRLITASSPLNIPLQDLWLTSSCLYTALQNTLYECSLQCLSRNLPLAAALCAGE